MLVALIALTATLSGLMMISKPDGSILQLPPDLLVSTPFKNYLVPGLVLTFVVGGVNMLAVVANLSRSPQRYNLSLVGGIIICTWIIVQMIMIHAIHWLHFLYLGAGLLIILIAYQLKGKWIV